MTELNIAYSYNGNDMMDDNSTIEYQPEPSTPQHQQQQPKMQMSSVVQQSPPQLQPEQLQPQQLQSNYYQQQVLPPQPPPRRQQQQYSRTPQYSFWDRMMMSRSDLVKLILLAFVVVLGISIEKFGSHYINSYLTDNILSPVQELLVRLSYPLLIFIILWIIKSL